MAAVAVGLLVFAGARTPDTGTGDDRLYALAGQLKCLQCVGESAAASQAPLAEQFRDEIREQMATGATDDEIFNFFVDRYGEQVLLDPPTSGAGLLVWMLPVAVLVVVVVGLGFAFRRWRAAPVDDPVAAAALPADPGAGDVRQPANAGGSADGSADMAGFSWRPVAVGGALVVFVLLAGWLVVWGSDDRGDGQLTGVDLAEGGTAGALSQCGGPASGDAEASIECFDEVLDERPDDVEALTYRGWAKVRSDDVAGGADDLGRAVELDPTYPDARVFRAVVASGAGEFELARDELAVFWANDPSDVAVAVVQSEGLERKVWFGLMSEPTRACWQEAASGGGDSIDQAFLDVLGGCLDDVLAEMPEDPEARLSRALAHVGPDDSDVPAARQLLAGLLEDDPDNADALALRVSLDLAEGNLDAASEGIDELEMLPRGPAAFLIGDATTLRAAYSAAREESLPNPEGG